MSKKTFLFSLIPAAILLSCQHPPGPVPTPPSIVITPPADSLFFSGETLFIVADISDEDALHEASIYVKEPGDTLFAFEPNVMDLPSYHVDTFWVVSGTGTATLSFEAENHHGITTGLSLPFSRF